MFLRLLGPLCIVYLLNLESLVAEAAPLGRPNGFPRRRQYARQNEIPNLIANITDTSVSDAAGVTQTLGSLFGGSSNFTSSATDAPSVTVSDPLPQSTDDGSAPSATLSDDAPSPTVPDPLAGDAPAPPTETPDSSAGVSTSTMTLSLPLGADAGSGAGDAFSMLSQFMGAIPTSLPSTPAGDGPIGVSPPSGGFDGPKAAPDFPSASHQGGDADCAETYTVVAGDTCAAICSIFDVSAADFLRMNPSVGAACMNLQIGQQYCVQPNQEDNDEDEDADDDGWKQATVVHMHKHKHKHHGSSQDSKMPPTATPPGGFSPNDLPLPPPTAPSSPISSEMSSPPFTSPEGLNSPGSAPSTSSKSSSNSTASSDASTSSVSSSNTTAFPSAGQPLGDPVADLGKALKVTFEEDF
ncbi:hypothetical protein B0H15DRAFT_814708 [Mycena belliarum]|uniref:LysM domain-containing protein n=1 Tax=Mycena belliarum TaxID=1033014 RepID=A0AAD6UHD9_9AGAR|nr:hypothetical protein B0H15DRAFT_814708 [Mycena belliae]